MPDFGGNDTQTTTQNTSTEYPQWTQDALQGLVGTGLGLNAPFIGAGVPNFMTAGFTPAQEMSFDLAGQSAEQAFTGGPTAAPTGGSYQAASVGPANMATAQTMSATDIGDFMDPYMEGVIDPTVKMARRQANATQSDIGSRAASAQAMGGSQEAMERALARRGANENLVGTVSNLMSGGYDRAQGYAQTQANTRQQTELANVGAQNQFQLQDAAYEQQANMGNPGLAMEQARLQDAMKTSDLSRQMTALQQLLGVGNQQQLFQQSVLDQPWTALSRWAGLVPQVYNTQGNTTKTEPDNSPSFLQQVLGAGTTLGSSYLAGKKA